MINNELLEYIRKQLGKGASRESISQNLKSAGWSDADVSEGFLAITPQPATPAAVPIQTQTEPKVATPPLTSPMTTPVSTPATPTPQNTFESHKIGESEKIEGLHSNNSTRGKKIFTIIAGVVGLAIIGGGVYAYQTGLLGASSLNSMLTEALESSKGVKTSTFDLNMEIDASGLTTDAGNPLTASFLPTDFDINIRGSADETVTENPKVSAIVTVNAGMFSGEGEIRIVDKIMYLMLTKIPTLPISAEGMDFQNKWFSLDIEQPFAGSPLESIALAPTGPTELTEEEKNHILDLTKNSGVLKETGKLAPKSIDGVLSQGFTFELDRDALVKYMEDLTSYLSTELATEMPGESFDSQAFSEGLAALQDFHGEIWISKSDKMIRQVTASFAIVPPEEAGAGRLTMSFDVKMGNFNEPVTIEAPAESTPLFEMIMGTSMENARAKGQDAAIKASLSNMRAQAELHWDANNGSYSGVCVSKEFKMFSDSISQNGGKLICNDSARGWRGYSNLNTPTNPLSYWCVDSTGSSRQIERIPAGYTCQ